MIRVSVCFDDIAEAAQTLQEKGENPTIDRVRTFLGGKGSNTTISKYLNMWRSQLPSLQQEGISSSPPDPVQSAVKRVWQQIREETDAEIQKIKSETQKLLDEAIQREENTVNENKKLSILCEGVTDQLYALQAAHEIQKLDYKKLSEEHTLLQERYKSLNERYVDLQNITAKHYDDMINAHKNEINHFLEKSKAQEVTYQKLIDELKSHNEDQRQRNILEVDSLKTQNQKLEKSLDQLKSLISSKDIELLESKSQLHAVLKERDGLSSQLSDQEKYWELFKKSNEVTDKIWMTLKEQPKFDFNLSYISYFNDIKDNILLSMEKFGKNTNDVKLTLEKLINIKNLNTNNE